MLVAQSDIEARLGRSLTAEETTAFSLHNSAMQAYVERLIGSSVEAVDFSTRYYDGGVQHLSIDPCTDIQWIKQVDDDSVSVYDYDTTDYIAEPRNRTVKTWLRHRSGPYMRGMNNIAVNAKFSIYADEGLRNIVKDMLIDAILGETQNSGNIKRESIEGYSVEYVSTDARNSLDRLLYYFPGIA